MPVGALLGGGTGNSSIGGIGRTERKGGREGRSKQGRINAVNTPSSASCDTRSSSSEMDPQSDLPLPNTHWSTGGGRGSRRGRGKGREEESFDNGKHCGYTCISTLP